MTNNTQNSSEYWRTAEPEVTYRDKNIHVKRRMTEYEADIFKFKADKLLSQLEQPQRKKHSINRFVAYGDHRLIGAYMKVGDDPLGNGIIIDGFDDFEAAAVNASSNHGEVYIRFRYTGGIDMDETKERNESN